MIARKPRNHKRKRILDENLMQYKNEVQLSERNIHVVEDYVAGGSETQLAEKYGISRERVSQIVHTYIRHCLRVQRKH